MKRCEKSDTCMTFVPDYFPIADILAFLHSTIKYVKILMENGVESVRRKGERNRNWSNGLGIA